MAVDSGLIFCVLIEGEERGRKERRSEGGEEGRRKKRRKEGRRAFRDCTQGWYALWSLCQESC